MKKTLNPKVGDWIYWRWKKSSYDKIFNKSYIQEIIETIDGKLLDLSDGLSTNYPTRILRKEIYIVKISKE